MQRSLGSLVPDRIRRRFARKFLVVGAVVLVLVSGLGAATFLQTEAQLRQTTEGRLESSAAAQSANLGAWIDGLRSEVALTAEAGPIENGDTEAVEAYLKAKAIDGTLDESVMALHYLDTTQPQILASSNNAFVGVNPEAEGVPWAQGGVEVSGDEPVVTDAFPGPRVEQPVVAVISPIETKPDRVLVFMVNVGARTDRLPEQRQETITRVVNSDGTIVMSHHRDEILTQNAASETGVEATAIQRGLDGTTGYTERDGENGTTAIGYAPIEGVDWVVTTRTPKSDAFALQQTITRNIGVLVGISVLGFLVLGLTIGRPTAKALDDLAATATAIADGNIGTGVPESDRIDELGEVQTAFEETREYIATVGEQVDALAAQRFDADVFDRTVPGPLGTAIATTRQDLQSSIGDLESARDDAEAAQRDAEAMATELNRQAEQFREVMERTAEGDLTQRLDPDVDHPAMVDIAERTNEMLSELEATVASVRQFARTVDTSADQICTSAEEIETTSQEVATTTQEIADGAREQDEYLSDAVREISDLSATVEEIAASSDEVADQSSSAADLGREGCQQATVAADEIASVADEVETVAQEVSRLDDEMERIGEIIDLIDDIAKQTNLLALNANIEAAHANGGGDAGDGFAVVAEEVKDLAEETSAQTEEIEGIIRGVQASTGELAADMHEARKRMLDGATSVEETKEIFEDVVSHVEEANDGIHAINEATDQQASATSEIVAMVDDVSEIGADTAEETGELAAAAEEQTASITSVTEQIMTLSEKAERLEALTADFEVTEDRDNST